LILGIDVGATKIAIGLFDAPGNIVKMETLTSRKTEEKNSSIESILEKAYINFNKKHQYKYEAIGIGVVGHTDPDRGTWLNSSNLFLKQSINMHDIFHSRSEIPIFLDNDVNAATMAEQALGKGKSFRHFIYINLGSGIAAGIVNDGILIRGGSNYAGELGYNILAYDGKAKSLESEVSGIGIRTFLMNNRNKFSEDPAKFNYSASALFKFAEAGDNLAIRQIEKIRTLLFLAVHNLITIFNPEAVVFGGSLAHETAFLQSVKEQLYDHLAPIPLQTLKFWGPSELGVSTVGIIGAAQLAFDGIGASKEKTL
jgi:glucokinase